MYVALQKDLIGEKCKTTPCYYSEGLHKAKRDLRLFALALITGTDKKVYSYNYSLEEFRNAVIARYADQDNKSIDIIEFETSDSWITNPTGRTTITHTKTIYLVEMLSFETVYGPKASGQPSGPVTIKEQVPTRMTTKPIGVSPSLDGVMQELKDRIKRVEAEPEYGMFNGGPFSFEQE